VKKPLSVRALIIPVVSAMAALALIALALIPRPDAPEPPAGPAALDAKGGDPPPLREAKPVPAPRN
jgi:hypothetical protein